MIDIKLNQNDNGTFSFNWNEENGDFEMVDDYSTAVLMSTFCDRRAQEYEVAETIYRRGWIGDLVNAQFDGGDGSGLYLYEKSRKNTLTTNNINAELAASYQWLIGEYVNNISTKVYVNSGDIMIDVNIKEEFNKESGLTLKAFS